MIEVKLREEDDECKRVCMRVGMVREGEEGNERGWLVVVRWREGVGRVIWKERCCRVEIRRVASEGVEEKGGGCVS